MCNYLFRGRVAYSETSNITRLGYLGESQPGILSNFSRMCMSLKEVRRCLKEILGVAKCAITFFGVG